MNITKHTVATIEYTLTDDSGAVIDSSIDRDPFSYIHGIGNIIPGLENALEGKTAGDSFSVTILPEDGYGVRDEAMKQEVSRELFNFVDDLQEGMQFQTPVEEGTQVITVVKVEDDMVTVDGNHPLAGAVLNFQINVVDVREASAEELDHGHAHGPGGHDH